LPKTRSSARKQSKDDARASRDESGTTRPFWSGTISFGLVSIPVNLFPANVESRVSLRMLSPDGVPLKREFVSAETGEELEEPETTRGYEIGGKYVTVTEEELERLAPEKSRDINLRLFVTRDELTPVYFNRAYFLAPSEKTGKAYRLLAEAMEETGRAGIATFVMRGHEHLIAIFAEGGILRAQTLRFHDEIRKPTDIGLPKKSSPPPQTLRKFGNAIAELQRKSLDLSEMRDEYARGMLALIAKKQKTRKPSTEMAETIPRPAQVVDLMEVLKKSLGSGKNKS
jgi:DNA end-binding protein Ku